jgi:ADP-heptose:LPS heptosyltransferase
MADLVIMHKQLGDTVLLEPVLRKISAITGEKANLLGPAAFEPLIELMPHTRLVSGQPRPKADHLWAFDWGSKTTLASALTRCRNKHLLIPNPAWIKWHHRLVFSRIEVEAYRDRYMARYFWDHTYADATGQIFTPPRLTAAPDDWVPDHPLPSDYLLLNPVSAWKQKCYPLEQWKPVLEGLHEAGLEGLVISGGREPWHAPLCESIGSLFPGKSINLCGRTSLREFIALVMKARALLSVDGAATHLAQAFSVPSLTIFGPSLVDLWHPPAHPTRRALAAAHITKTYRPDIHHLPATAILEEALDLLRTQTTLLATT